MRSPRRLPKPDVTLRGARSTLRFYHADSLVLLARLPVGVADVVITSPPYNLGVRYRSYSDTLPHAGYLEWTNLWVAAVSRVLQRKGSLFLNVGTKPTRPWTAIDIAQEARQHLKLQNTIHWIKSIVIEQDAAGRRAALDRDLAVGHYKPINSDRFLHDCHEYVFHLTPDGNTPLDRLALGVSYQDPSNVTRWQAAADGLRCRGNTWFIPYETIQNRDRDRPHPATFPPKLPKSCLRLHGLRRVRTALDPFMGLGSTAVACAELGVDFIGIEMDRGYLDEAVSRARAALKKHRPVRKKAHSLKDQ